MILKHLCGKLLLFSISGLLAGAMAFGQTQAPGSPGQQSPNMPQQTPGTGIGTMNPADTTSNPQAMDDRAFMRKALEGGDTEVQMGKLAQQKSQSADVKQFGEKMVEDHTQMGEQMKPIAQQLGVQEPKGLSKKDRMLLAKLDGLSGQQFDEAYIKTMVKDHKQDLKEFKEEAQATQNPNLKQAAQQGAGVISQHLQMIQQIAQSHNVATSVKGSGIQ